MSTEYFSQTKRIPFLFRISKNILQNWQCTRSQNNSQQVEENWNTLLNPARLPWSRFQQHINSTKSTNSLKLNNSLQTIIVSRKKYKRTWRFPNENRWTTYQNVWNTMKVVLRWKFTVLSAYIKKLKRFHTSKLIMHLKDREQKEENTPNRSRQLKWSSWGLKSIK